METSEILSRLVIFCISFVGVLVFFSGVIYLLKRGDKEETPNTEKL